MSFLSTEYCYKGKSNLLKFIDQRNKNFYKLMNGRKYRIVSGNVTEKSYHLKGCKKVIVLVKCMLSLPLLAVTLVLKITNKENKLAAKRFEQLQQKKSLSLTSNVTQTLSVKISEFVSPHRVFSKSTGGASFIQRVKDSSKAISVVSLGEQLVPSNKVFIESCEPSTQKAKDSSKAILVVLSGEQLAPSKSCELSTQSAKDSSKGSSVILLGVHSSSAISLQDSEKSSAFQSAKTHLSACVSEQKDEQTAPSTLSSFFTNTVAPAAINGANYAAKWAINQIIKDGLIYGASALTGIPPADFKYGLQAEKAANTYGF